MKANEKQSVLLKQTLNEFRNVLTSSIKDCNQVFLIAHEKPDFDAIASLGAAGLICKKHKKAPYIIIDDSFDDLSDEAKEMIDKIKEKFIVITVDDYESNKTNNDLLIALDVNKGFRTALDGKYKQFKNIIIIDHHSEDENTIKTKNKFISLDASSCSEILYYLLNQYKITSSDISYYTFLLAGIYLDTNKLSKNKFPSTLEAVGGLINKGADQSKVDDFFALDFESDRRVHSLVDKTIPINTTVLVSVSDDGLYTQEEIAKAADYALNYKCDAVIIAAKMKDGSYGVSARGKGDDRISIDNIMYILNGGGGNSINASCPPIFKDSDDELSDIKKDIVDILTFKKIKGSENK